MAKRLVEVYKSSCGGPVHKKGSRVGEVVYRRSALKEIWGSRAKLRNALTSRLASLLAKRVSKLRSWVKVVGVSMERGQHKEPPTQDSYDHKKRLSELDALRLLLRRHFE
eukprot:1183057-Prorocentrum_minimum.AAC.3